MRCFPIPNHVLIRLISSTKGRISNHGRQFTRPSTLMAVTRCSPRGLPNVGNIIQRKKDEDDRYQQQHRQHQQRYRRPYHVTFGRITQIFTAQQSTMQPPFPAPVTEWHNDTYDAIHPTRPELSQTGKNIVITGAGSGIGREVVTAFAQAGASTIHILGRTKSTLEETKQIVEKRHSKTNIILHVADIVDESAVKVAAEKIGSWDVIVANAGDIPSPETIESSDANEWWKTFEVRLPSFSHHLATV